MKINNDKSKLINLIDVFPSAEVILKINGKKKTDVLKNCKFIIDSNSLLVPFSLHKDELRKIKSVYVELLSKQKVFVPEHVLREFAKNRSKKISEIFTSIDNLLNSIPSINLPKYPILDQFKEFEQLSKIKENFNQVTKEYKVNLTQIKDGIEDWNWNDPVTKMYSSLFENSIIKNLDLELEELIKQYYERLDSGIPPGNKDRSKEFNAMGDFIIWLSILEFGKRNKSDLVLVTNDEKSDWQVKGNQKSIATRFELVEEYYRVSGGYNFLCINFEEFLKINGLNIEIQQETIFPNYTVDDGPLSWIILEKITKIFRKYLNNKEFILYMSEEIDEYMDSFLSVYTSEFLGKTEVDNISIKLTENFNKIKSLNYRVKYEEIRMKRSTTNEQKELDILVKSSLLLIDKLKF